MLVLAIISGVLALAILYILYKLAPLDKMVRDQGAEHSRLKTDLEGLKRILDAISPPASADLVVEEDAPPARKRKRSRRP